MSTFLAQTLYDENHEKLLRLLLWFFFSETFINFIPKPGEIILNKLDSTTNLLNITFRFCRQLDTKYKSSPLEVSLKELNVR